MANVLQPVQSAADVRLNVETFNDEAARYYNRAARLLRETTYWVYDPATESFGPSKFVGFAATRALTKHSCDWRSVSAWRSSLRRRRASFALNRAPQMPRWSPYSERLQTAFKKTVQKHARMTDSSTTAPLKGVSPCRRSFAAVLCTVVPSSDLWRGQTSLPWQHLTVSTSEPTI
mgnify:CR=1 FL=1